MTSKLATLLGTAVLAFGVMAGSALAQSSDWDSDGDGMVSQEEFDTGFDDAGIYDDWDVDGDGMLSEDEFDTGLYDAYDADDSDMLEEPELGDLNDDMGDGGFWDV